MAKYKTKCPESKRFRLSVPGDDESVLEWILHQNNLSMSLRVLIKRYIRQNGYTDATCEMVSQSRAGRPSLRERELEEKLSQLSAEEANQRFRGGSVQTQSPEPSMPVSSGYDRPQTPPPMQQNSNPNFNSAASHQPFIQPQSQPQQPAGGSSGMSSGASRAAAMLDGL